jgi:tetratricopeptide (TPR) repeat protein
MIIFFLLLNIEARIDSVEEVFAQNRQIETLLQLNQLYVTAGQFHKSLTLLGQNERLFRNDADIAMIKFELGNVFMFAGEIDRAHDSYLELLSRYPRLEIANNAAERLYLIETMLEDSIKMKRLINVVRLYETEQYDEAIDSARVLLGSRFGAHAYYYMALAYQGLGDLTLMLSALEELDKTYPENRIYEALFLRVSAYMILGKVKSAREILEDLIVREPNTIYTLRARQKLEKMDGVKSRHWTK